MNFPDFQELTKVFKLPPYDNNWHKYDRNHDTEVHDPGGVKDNWWWYVFNKVRHEQ